jgi:S-DNA-T family DNA segregation ATPase FtsK/SpoIIIE
LIDPCQLKIVRPLELCYNGKPEVTELAKKKRRKKSVAATLKYEVYGILLITISIIALSGEATVGRALSKLFGLILGKFYFVLALVGIFVGLSVMVKRAWPRGWTSRRTGLLVLVLAFALSSAITEINVRFAGVEREALSGGVIVSVLNESLQVELLQSPPIPGETVRDKAISGGYTGALLYGMLFSLFGYYGAFIINFVMYVIALMLVTGKSYVELVSWLKKRVQRVLKLLFAKLKSRRRRKRKAPVAAALDRNGDAMANEADVIEDDDHYEAEPKKKRKSLFFAWKQQGGEDGDQGHHDEWQLPEQKPAVASDYSYDEEAAGPWEQSGEIHDGLEDRNQGEAFPPWEGEAAAPGMPEQWEPDIHNEADAYQQPQGSHPWENEHESDNAAHGFQQMDEGTPPELASDIDGEEGGQMVDEAAEESIIVEGDDNAPRRPIAEPQADIAAPKPYRLPPFSLLNKPSGMNKSAEGADMYDSRRKLEATLESFGVRAKVLDVVRGPAVTRYEVQPATGVKVSRIVGLTDDIALALAAKDIRMEAPIPGKSAIGIEVPNSEVSVVTMREVMETPAFQNATSKLSIAFGRDISGTTIVGNLARMPHLLVAGATGSGKSVCINGIITSILYKAKPDEVKFLMIDPKMVELNVYNGIPHLLAPVVTNPRRASLALKKIVVEMEKRYELFSKSATRNIEGYNALMEGNPSALLPYIVVIVDELADLMMVAANDVEDAIARLAQMARAAGIHLIIATQRPSVDVITGVIKANIPSRIAFGVSSQVDSRTILDSAGAEKLLGRGDMLFLPVGVSKPTRVQGAFLSDSEVEALVAFARDQGEAEYKEDLVPEIDEESSEEGVVLDELFDQAVQIVVEAKQASVSLLQRRMRIGYTRAARLIDQMEAKAVVGPYEGSKPREVLITPEMLEANKVSS